MESDETTEFALWGARHCQRSCSDSQLQAFFEHCVAHAGSDYDGIVYKVRHLLGVTTAAIHVPGLGSLTARNWSHAGLGLDFSLIERDTFFLESYLDDRPAIELNHAVWGPCYGAQKLSEAGKSMAALSTFTAGGREYVQLGGMSSGTRREGCAWLVGSLADWSGPTFASYRDHIEAYDAGTVQRGDNRGLLVKVRGVACVLVSAALVYDNNASAAVLPAEEEEDLLEDNELCELDESEEVTA